MTTNCTSCHGSTGASDGVSLTSAALVRAHLNKVDSEVASGAMPPRGSTSLTAQQKEKIDLVQDVTARKRHEQEMAGDL